MSSCLIEFELDGTTCERSCHKILPTNPRCFYSQGLFSMNLVRFFFSVSIGFDKFDIQPG